MKRVLLSLIIILNSSLFALHSYAQGWPSKYPGVMLQGFYWDSFTDTRWQKLEKQADDLAKYFSLIWIPQSGNCDGTSMGYNPKYYFDQNSSFGTEDELRSMIKTFKDKGLGTIADVVINHRQNLSSWVDFPAETYNGVTYQMVSTDIVSDDDGGKTAAEAKKLGVSLSPNKDSGEGWDGMRDIDHASENVQKIVKAYENYLLNDLGYTGFRYDVGKGFAAKYFGMYNVAAKPQFSVGEVWDSNTTIKNWIDNTKTDGAIQSAAFDFQFRYQVRDAINNGDWSKVVGSNCLIKDDAYKRYAVTFVENHDTELRYQDYQQDPIRKDTLAANAFLLAMPGTPCVFLKHWQKYKKEIKLMIEARRMMGIHNESAYRSLSPGTQCTAVLVTGEKGNLIVAVGPTAKDYNRVGYKELMSGYKYKYLVEESVNLDDWNAIVSRISEEEKPLPFDPYDATLYVNVDQVNWTKVNFHTWGGTHTGTTWPGKTITDTKIVNGKKWYYQTFRMNQADDVINIVVSTNSGSPQTVDAVDFNHDAYLEVTNTQIGGKYTFRDVTADYTGIDNIIVDQISNDNRIFNIGGQYVGNNAAVLKAGLYIQNGKKILIK